MNIAALLANAARTFGERPAISVGDELRLTYAQLHRRIVRLAGALSARPELVPGDRVALVMANRPQYIELLQAIWHAGLCAVPINARLHPREIEFILGNCAVKLCFVTEDVAESVAPLRAGLPALAGVISVDDPDYERLLQAEPVPQYAADGADLAWIFYTSGTTGRPKGAMLSHRNLLMMAMSYLCDVDLLTPEESFFYLGPLSHGAGLLGLSHLAKATHQVLPASGGFDPGELVDLINRHRHATFFLAPTMLRRFLDAPNIASVKAQHIRTLICGAAPVYASDVKRTLSLLGACYWNGYGQGECPCTITALPKAAGADMAHPRFEERITSVGIGRTGVEVRVVDAEDREAAAGEIGEIIVRSEIVMQGYWNDPAASAAALKGGWLRTGDLGAFDADGFLTLKDRLKDMIISGGSNIYPREVEDVLAAHPDVSEVAVVGAPDEEWGERAVAFVAARPGRQPSADALDRLCLQSIARFKRPKEYHFLDELPKNNYGKVLKTELRERARRTAAPAKLSDKSVR